MKFLSVVSTLALTTSLSLAFAAPAKPGDSLKVVKRLPKAAPAPALAQVVDNKLEERGFDGGGSDTSVDVGVDVNVQKGRPDYDYSPDGASSSLFPSPSRPCSIN